ncbi:MAG: pirin family protein [Deltaproteobacteria bacterium]|nr:pirin family protein [Deltaproteobacteria bacterium]
MITLRPSAARAHFDHGWLDTRHTFSFADYYDPAHMGFRDLRVINEDRVEAGQGFGTHGHRDMEIISYVLEGELAHRDSTGGGGTLRPGDVQRMSAGSGVQHSEFNGSREKPVHFLQIWLLPGKKGIAPSYDQKNFPEAERLGVLRPVASPDGRDGSLAIHQDVVVRAGLLEPGQSVALDLAPGRHAWVQLARGSVTVNGQALQAGDGAAISDETRLELKATGDARAELLVFDLR